jgi:UbiD family decarboxylase
MDFRQYVDKLEKEGNLLRIKKVVSTDVEAAAILKTGEPRPVLFENIKENKGFRIVGNVFCTKESMAKYFGITTADLIPRLVKAIDQRSQPEEIKNAPCQEVDMGTVDLNKLPLLRHTKTDGGRYISSAVVVSRDPEYGQNLDFHRAMPISNNKMSTRVVEGRDFHKFLERNGEVEAAYCVGNTANVLVAAAISVQTGIDEMYIANALEKTRVTKAKSVNLLIPADCEVVLEGRVFMKERAAEGPFIDITDTFDIVRQEPVFEVKKITHRKDPIWQALLPGALEHKLLMGMPKEPTIFKKVTEAGVRCLDVNVDPGGCSWLHAIVKIDKKNEDDGKKAALAAFEGHKSCKHVFVVDKDIDIYDPLQIEWSMATRFQADRGIVNKGKEPGSSLDPSAEPGTKITNKVGFDLTAPVVTKGKSFARAEFPRVDLKKYVEG